MGMDPVDVDSKHYKVEFENDQVRVLGITYGPKEMSEMHEHPDAMGVFLTVGEARFHYEDGTSEEISWKAGDASWFSPPRGTIQRIWGIVQSSSSRLSSSAD